MYKIYINSSCLAISTHPVDGYVIADINDFNAKDSTKLLNFIEKNKFVCFVSTDTEFLFNQFSQLFECVTAAGGIVENNSDILIIKRNNHWDLPKGHIENNESIEEGAIREVCEECGLSEIELHEKIGISYHIYPWDNHFRLKTTHWYRMTSKTPNELHPQTEEGISEVCWIPLATLDSYLVNSYGNIRDIIRQFKLLK
jgi:ADP-ribose pyrophosphatase YjhB (NUDIX family)